VSMNKPNLTSVHSPQQLSLKQRILSAGSWTLTGSALNYAIRLGSNLVITRLLVPQMFGVMAIAMMVMTGLAMFSDFGLTQNIVQSKRGSDPDYLNTVWTIQILRGVLLWLLALCISLLIFAANRLGLVPTTSVYADPYVPYVIAGVSITSVIGALRSTKYSEASRYLSLGRITQMQLVSQIVGLICMFGWVLIDPSIWGLVAANICSSIVGTMLSHIWLPGSANRLHWDRSASHEIIHFGKWMFLSSILGFFANNADRMLLGGYVDAATLGIYSIAYTFSSAVSGILNMVFSQISYPALSEVARERSSDLKRTLYRFHMLTASFTYLCAGGVIASGDTLIHLLYDSRYAGAGWMLQFLAVGLLCIPFNLAQFCLLARGLATNFAGVIAVRVAATIVLVPLGFHFYGVPGAVCGIVASQLSNVPVTIYFQVKYGLFDPYKEILLLPALLGGLILGLAFNRAMGY
jgi:O-antigen/teichoic acid export membrane protein